MSLPLSVLGMGRNYAQSRFTETFTFEREQMVDDVNGVPVPTMVAVAADIQGRVKSVSQVVSPRESGAQLVTVQQREVHVASGSVPAVREGDVARVTASTSDTGLVGRSYRISGDAQMGQTTAWRFPVTEV